MQATLPPMAECSVGDDSDRDELLYRPNSIESGEEEDYIKLARCYRTYTLSGNHMLDSQKNARVSCFVIPCTEHYRSSFPVSSGQ